MVVSVNKKDIILMAQKAQFFVKDNEAYSPSNQEDFELTECLERFAGLVAAAVNPPTPNCPKDLYQFDCEIEGVDLVCFLEYIPEEKGSTDYIGLPYEPDYEECMTLNNAYIAGTDVDIAHMILQSLVDHIEVTALEKLNDR